jgi:hypothetical protein
MATLTMELPLNKNEGRVHLGAAPQYSIRKIGFGCPDGKIGSGGEAEKTGSIQGPGLTLRILEACSGALAAIFLAFLNARIAGKETGPFQNLPVFRIEFEKRFGNTVPNRSSLAANPAAKHVDGHIELAERTGKDQWLSNYHFAGLSVQILIGRLSVYNDLTRPRLKPNPRD